MKGQDRPEATGGLPWKQDGQSWEGVEGTCDLHRCRVILMSPGSVIVELDVPAQVIKHPPHQASVPSPVKWGE